VPKKKSPSKPSSATQAPESLTLTDRKPTRLEIKQEKQLRRARSEIVQDMRRKRGLDLQPDWAFWSSIDEVRIWDGVALWLNIEPRWVSVHGLDKSQEFKDRLLLAIRSSNDKLPRIARQTNPGNSTVALSQFAVWALSIGWTAPDELAVFAKGGPAASKSKAPDGILRRMQEKYDELRASENTTPADRMQRKLERETGISRGAIRRRWHLMKL